MATVEPILGQPSEMTEGRPSRTSSSASPGQNRPVDHPSLPAPGGSGFISRLTWLVVIVLGAVSIGGWALIRQSVQHQDQAVLHDEAGQIGTLFQTALEDFQTELRSLAFLTVTSHNSPSVFAEQAKPLMTNPGVSVAVVDKSGPQPEVVLAAGKALHEGQPLPAALAAAAMRGGTTLSSGIASIGGQVFLYLMASPTTSPHTLGFEVSQIRPGVATPNNKGPYSRVYVNIYNGPTATPSQEIITTYGPRPLPGKTATAITKVGAVTWLTQVSARIAPAGSFAEASPWVALGVGLAMTLTLAWVVEALSRRNRHAAQLVEERTALYAQQRSVAETLQLALLPQALPAVSEAEVAVRYIPGVEGIQVGGDWYDVMPVDGRVLAVVGDVSGRGLKAASTMAALRFAARAYAAQGDPPEQILTKLSKALSVERTGEFATVLLCLFDFRSGSVTVASGGHLPVLRVDGSSASFVEANVGLPVGVSSDATYVSTSLPISPGSMLLAFTDGLVERRGESIDTGLDRLRTTVLAEPDPSLEALVSRVVGTMVGEGGADDTVMLGIRWRTT